MTMPKQMRIMLAAATLSAAAAVCSAQAANQSGPANTSEFQNQAAPVERAYANQNTYEGGEIPQPVGVSPVATAPGGDVAPTAGEVQATPIQGVILRVGAHSNVQEVSSDAQKLELRVERGLANINVHKPAKGTLILVDLPGGQTQILKDGLYTFNAETNTARVLKGEALAFPADAAGAKPIKVKEFNKVVYNGTNVRPQQFIPYEASVDVLPGPAVQGGRTAPAFGGYSPYGVGFYPYYAYGYPWAWGYLYPYYPYGFYPYGVGVGFGYYGGFHGGYHGGGFHGGGAHGGRGR